MSDFPTNATMHVAYYFEHLWATRRGSEEQWNEVLHATPAKMVEDINATTSRFHVNFGLPDGDRLTMVFWYVKANELRAEFETWLNHKTTNTIAISRFPTCEDVNPVDFSRIAPPTPPPTQSSSSSSSSSSFPPPSVSPSARRPIICFGPPPKKPRRGAELAWKKAEQLRAAEEERKIRERNKPSITEESPEIDIISIVKPVIDGTLDDEVELVEDELAYAREMAAQHLCCWFKRGKYHDDVEGCTLAEDDMPVKMPRGRFLCAAHTQCEKKKGQRSLLRYFIDEQKKNQDRRKRGPKEKVRRVGDRDRDEDPMRGGDFM